MGRAIRFVSFLLGAVVFAALVFESGPSLLLASVRSSGWVLAPVMALWVIVYCGNTLAWQRLVVRRPPGFTFWRAWALNVASFGLNYATPVIALGGEPIKVMGASPWLGRRRAAASVVGFRFLHSTAQLIVMLIALVPAAMLLPHTPAFAAGLVAAAVCLTATTAFLLSRHRAGVFERTLDLVARFPGFRRLRPRLEAERPRLRSLDVEFTAIHRESPRSFLTAMGLEIVARILSTLEFALILHGLGLGGDPVRAFVVANFSSLVIILLFFIPFELGAKEGSVYLIFHWLGFDPALGTAAAVLSRLRELLWMAIALVILWCIRLDAARPAPLRTE